MYNIKTLNAISPVWQEILPQQEYVVSAEATAPEAILVRSAAMHEMEIGKELLCVARAGAGVNNIPLEKMAEAGVVVFNTPGANANAVKELAVAAMLLASRRIPEAMCWCQGLKDGETSVEKQVEKGKAQFVGPELAGKTLGVIGLGAIGVQVANTGYALGMNVLGYDPFISVEHAWKLSRAVRHSYSMEEILEKSDYISLHVPLMDSTKNMINDESIAKMKPNVALLNLSRNGLVDNEAVKRALSQGKMRVYVTDFPSADLIGVPGVVLTPHLGASTPESEDNCVRMAAKQVKDYLENGSIVNSVNYPNCALTAPVGPRIALLHQNVPNVIGAVTQLVSGEGLNIDNMVNKSKGAYAYTVLDLNKEPSEALVAALEALDTMYRVRRIHP
ncbi:MAG: phosphoglycerate dehydrogenase [Eubacteriales bacterium]|nr:phosphoglycerate dehydrogenase [Eubacteriales bacterium]